jgi:hypothetical protein
LDYSHLDPPYYFYGFQSAMLFGRIQRHRIDVPADELQRPPLEFEVTDQSDQCRYLWQEVALYNPAFRSPDEVRLELSEFGGMKVGHAECRLSRRQILLHREGSLRLAYGRTPLSLNILLHLSAFCYILARGLGREANGQPPAAPQHIWGHNYSGGPSWT